MTTSPDEVKIVLERRQSAKSRAWLLLKRGKKIEEIWMIKNWIKRQKICFNRRLLLVEMKPVSRYALGSNIKKILEWKQLKKDLGPKNWTKKNLI